MKTSNDNKKKFLWNFESKTIVKEDIRDIRITLLGVTYMIRANDQEKTKTIKSYVPISPEMNDVQTGKAHDGKAMMRKPEGDLN